MVLTRFFRPKWQHPNPEVRRQALIKLSWDNPDEHAVLCDLAVQDPAAEVRKAAVKRVSDLALLRRRLSEDGDAGVREVAGARYRQLLAGGTETADLQMRLEELAQCADSVVLGYVARRGREPELRLAAIERLQSSAVLEEIAVHEAVPKLRQAAAQRLTEPAALERVLRQTRERDRKVARIVRDALERLQQEQAAAEKANAERRAVCEGLEQLADGGWHEGAAAERQRLENRWQAVTVPAPAELQQRYEAALARCRQLVAPPAPVAVPPVEPVAEAPTLDALVAALRDNAEPDPARLDELHAAVAEVREAAAEQQQQNIALLDAYLAAAARYLEHRQALDEAIAALEKTADDAAIRRLQGLIETIGWHSELPAPALLAGAASALTDARRRQEQLAERQQRRQAELRELLSALEASLGAGQLKESQRLLGKAQKLAEQLPGRERERLDRRLRRAAGRIRELQDWRRFATLPKQVELCEQMEALVDADLPPPELAARIHRLQEEWKATGGSASPEGKQLWERFHAAGEKAFDRCRGYFDEQAQRREANLQRRREILAQLERFAAEADWAKLELQALEAIRAQARSEWQAAMPVDRRESRPLEARFEPLMETITGHIRNKQQANRARKEELIRRAQALTTAEDPRAAAEEAKALQAEWKAVGYAQPNVDRRLWREFRSACDVIFARRDEARGEADQERQARIAEAEALCAAAEALAADQAIDLAEARAKFAELREQFQAVRPLPRERFQACSRRLREVERALDERRRALQRQREQALLNAARTRAQLCAELEQAGETADRDAFMARWQALEPAPAPLQAKLDARWQRALAAGDGSRPFTPDELAANLETRWDLCLWMEILADIEAPPEDRARRMDLQVRRLADGLAAGHARSPQEQARTVVADWLTTGPAAPAEQAARLEQRFEAAWEALQRGS